MEEISRIKRLLLIISLSCVACFLLARMLYLYLDDTQLFPITTIKIVANYQHITHEQVASLMESFQQRSYYTLPVYQLRQKLLSIPWAKKVEIERIYPDAIKITLEEKQPIAIWNDKVLTDDGSTFADSRSLAQLTHLPHFISAASSASSLETDPLFLMYKQITSLLAEHRFNIQSLEQRDNQAWDLRLTNGILLKLGKQDTLERIKRFVQVYPLLSEKPGHLVQIDLRYSKGMAVKWETL